MESEGMRLLREVHSMLKLLLKQSGSLADDSDLDGKYGDEDIKKSPPRWTGESFVGNRMSECSPEFLLAYADFKTWGADMDEKKAPELSDDERDKKLKYARYGRQSAARARGWAARLQSGWKRPASDNGSTDNGGW